MRQPRFFCLLYVAAIDAIEKDILYGLLLKVIICNLVA